MSETREFFAAVWPGGLEKGDSLLLWTRQGRISRWADSTDEAAGIAGDLGAEKDVYVGVGAGPAPADRSDSRRLKAGEVRTLPGHVADLDVAGAGHKQDNLFASREEVLQAVERLELQPSLMVASGGGLQLWWLYREPWILETDDDRERARLLSMGWSRHIADVAGRTVDPVFDLARVMRIPGTWNHKREKPRPVTLLAGDGPRYNPGDFEPWIAEPEGGRKRTAAVAAPEAPAQVDVLKLEMLIDLDARFRAAWNYRAGVYRTPSEYDLAMATKMWGAGWSEAEILAALVHWREKHNLDKKPESYYLRRTIPLAMASESANRSRQAIRVHTEIMEAASRGEPAGTEKKTIQEQVHLALGIPIDRIERIGDLYVCVLKSGVSFKLGTAEQAIKQPRWHSICWANQISITKLNDRAWTRVCDFLSLLVVDVKATDATPEGSIASWIVDSKGELVDVSGEDESTRAEFYCAAHRWGLIFKGEIYVHGPRLKTRLANSGWRIHDEDLVYRLKAIGATRTRLQARRMEDGSTQYVKRWYWRLPKALES